MEAMSQLTRLPGSDTVANLFKEHLMRAAFVVFLLVKLYEGHLADPIVPSKCPVASLSMHSNIRVANESTPKKG